jgi:hypothetical protein
LVLIGFFSIPERRQGRLFTLKKEKKTAKFWVKPFNLAESYGFSTRELNKLEGLVSENEELILREWREFHG